MNLRSGKRVTDIPIASKLSLTTKPTPKKSVPESNKSSTTPKNHSKPLVRAPLTVHNLESLQADLMGRKRKQTPHEAVEPSTKTTKTTTTKTTDPEFGRKLTANQVIHEGPFIKPPRDFQRLQEILDQPRTSTTADSNDHHQYIFNTRKAPNEKSLAIEGWTMLRKKPIVPKSGKNVYTPVSELEWTEPATPVTQRLANAMPDYMESLGIDEYPIEAAKDLNGFIQPAKHDPAMPLLCAEFKASKFSLKGAVTQGAYDGALMTESARSIKRYMGNGSLNEDTLGNTEALTIAYNGTDVQISANHAAAADDSSANTKDSEGLDEREGLDSDDEQKIQYHQYPIVKTSLETLEGFQNGYRWVRNAQDWARKKAIATKDALHDHARTQKAQKAVQLNQYRTMTNLTKADAGKATEKVTQE